jgi:hypothetical protein
MTQSSRAAARQFRTAFTDRFEAKHGTQRIVTEREISAGLYRVQTTRALNHNGWTMARWRERDWLDGHYELFMYFDDPYAWIDVAQALWSQPRISGVWTARKFDPKTDPHLDAGDVSVTCELMTNHLHGVADLPNGTKAPCGCGIAQDRNWLIFFLPIAGLGNCYRLGRYPFGDFDRPWVFEVDKWLVELATAVFRKVPFRAAAVGSELFTLQMLSECKTGVPESRSCGLLIPSGANLQWFLPTIKSKNSL